MKRNIIHLTIFLLFSVELLSQSYLNVLLSNGSYKHADLSQLKKITINTLGTQISFHMSDGAVGTENIADIRKITLRNTPEGSPLPAELSSFIALINGSNVQLFWRTETEVGNLGFSIQRKVDKDWTEIAFIQGYGNSNSPKEYSFTDSNPPQGALKYRLKQIDTDGNFHFSEVVIIKFNNDLKYDLAQNYPNPFNPSTNIKYNIPIDTYVQLKIYDVLGREVSVIVNEFQKAGSYTISFNAGDFPSGAYFYRITSGSFTDTKKFILIK